jgi:type IV pilus assembly protein PilC
MSSYAYIAIDPDGSETRGTLDVADQTEALRRIKEMGLFPTKVLESANRRRFTPTSIRRPGASPYAGLARWLQGRVRTAQVVVFTRQLATLVEAGMPLLRGLRILAEQAENRALKRVIGDISVSIENGGSLAEALAAHPTIFNALYVNMVRAGELSGALESTLGRLADFMEKARRLKGKIKAAMFYPCAVLAVACVVVGVMVVFVVPRFQAVFEGLMDGRPLPAFTRFVFGVSQAVARHVIPVGGLIALLIVAVMLALRTHAGRSWFDRLKLSVPVLGPLFRKVAISRFAGTLGTLISNGVPILQALNIVKDTAGNKVVGRLIETVHENVKQGEPMAPTLKASLIFPAMVAGMVDVGEQTGALPEMLGKIAQNYDAEVDNAAAAMTSILEPLLLVFLAVVVGGIVIAMYLPIIAIVTDPGFVQPGGGGHGGE